MSYTCRIFSNTGFNATNRPDSPSLLNNCSYTDLASMDILQDGELNAIRVNATYSQIKNADYAKVGDWYYAIIGRHMENPDTCTLALLPDYTLSAGGAASLTYLDGITERVHVAKNSDTFGAYAEDDPLTAPSQPLEISIENISLGTGTMTIIESAIDLLATATSSDAITYTDALGEKVTVPNYSSLSQYTDHAYGGTHKTASYIVPTPTPGTPELLQAGIDRARALGVESAIIGQYNVPDAFLTGQAAGFKATLAGATLSNNTAIPFVQNSGAKNNRINYGEYTKYGMLTAGGNKAEYNAEEIYDSSLSSPKVTTVPDVRKDGCPYHRFETYLGDKTTTGFWRNCLAGAQWEQVPIVYNQKDKSALDVMQFDAQKKYAYSSFERSLKSNTVQNMVGGMGLSRGMDTVYDQGPKGGVKARSAFNPMMYAGSMIGAAATSIYNAALSIADFTEREELSALNFAASQVVAPDIQFPYNTDIMRDALGNGVVVYRYKYSSTDVSRVDKLLTMYGYRVTKPLETSDFTNRSKFNFVRANNVSVGNLPKWWADGIAAELATGIRFWHVLPDTSIYTSGQN